MENLPYVSAALICERVIQEKDGTLSAIRIIERAEAKISVRGEIPSTGLQEIATAIQLAILVSLKSGPFKGKGILAIDSEKPTGEIKRMLQHEFEFLGDEHGQNAVVNLTFQVREDGLYWFNVLFNEALLAKIPLRLVRTVERVAEKTSDIPRTG